MPNFGDVRADGFIFRGMQTRANGKRYEQWVSPEVWKKRIQAQRKWQRDNYGEKQRTYAKNYEHAKRRAKPEYFMFNRARARALQTGLEFTITHEDVVIPQVCPILKRPIYVGGGEWAPELDRADNSKGYVPGNVVVISRRANRIKNNSTLQELKQIYDFYSVFFAFQS